MKNVYLSVLLLFLLAAPEGQALDNLKAFPPAEEGMVRYLLQLPQQDDESALRVELIVSKTVEVDEQNNYFFGGTIEKETIAGWGFTLYKVSRLGPMVGTLMAIDSDMPKVARLITLGSDPYLIRYSSRLPIVVYLPNGVEVRYRVWTAGAEVTALEKG